MTASVSQVKHNRPNKNYPDYGERGITVSEEWLNDFWAFYDHIGHRPAGTTLDRIDNNLGYFPGNVRWATPRQQARNRRNNTLLEYSGRKKSITEWAEEYGVKETTIHERLKRGWGIGSAIGAPDASS